ncbi:uncharacterized protein STEHIDRAFT_116319 [Stereum hirsutum FP-91666 SS1]|uniref:Uncharacterized protein n=1 Tax=Stereum hirsutum (strain FP-91666) TaxID=721885 RepID=R7RWZ1_STEHR|nr:uncharacterized protein STEHIDRAFT_116319 [Stereum hirsutum FP-91666 SS1]EIM79854.1 hypothetical protein STEHIDRAFT_116319 [Stereum hirsutum FP-91666 SS1]
MSDIDGERAMEFMDVLDVSIEQFMANVLPIMNMPWETLAPEDAEVARQLKDILVHSPDTTRILSSPTSTTSREIAPADTSFSFDRSTSTDDTLSGYDTSFVRQGDSSGLSDSSDSSGDLRSLSISSLSQSQELAIFNSPPPLARRSNLSLSLSFTSRHDVNKRRRGPCAPTSTTTFFGFRVNNIMSWIITCAPEPAMDCISDIPSTQTSKSAKVSARIHPNPIATFMKLRGLKSRMCSAESELEVRCPVWFKKMQVRVGGRTHSPAPSFSGVSTSSIPVDKLRGQVETVEVIVAELGKEVKELGKEVKELNKCFADLAEEMKRRDEETEKRFAQLGEEMKDIKDVDSTYSGENEIYVISSDAGNYYTFSECISL